MSGSPPLFGWRRWLAWGPAALLALAASLPGDHASRAEGAGTSPKKPPNIVWLVLDDASPTLGAYGDSRATTPNMDRLAGEGALFTRAFTHAPVCAPSRCGLVTGMYATTIGCHHMRSKVMSPPETFMSLLRKAGYYVAWPGKTDFNFDAGDAQAQTFAVDPPAGAYDSRADWLGAAPPPEPFFAYLNLGVVHEGQVRADAARHAKNTARLTPAQRHDPARMRLPAYWPDAPEVRHDLAQYYDLMTAADYQVGDVLRWLDERAVSGRTVVLLFGDHGRGMPREKRWVYDAGIHVPLIVRWPEEVRAGTVRDDLVAFVDFAPTMLALADVEVPARMEGRVFLGPRRAKPRAYVYAARDRMDETPDRIRAVRDERFEYIRNFRPELPYAQRIAYNEENPTMRAWRRLHEEGRLSGPPALFFAPAKPREELYDTRADPDEVHDLAADPRYRAVLARMRGALDDWIRDTGDLGEISEDELVRRGLVREVRRQYEAR